MEGDRNKGRFGVEGRKNTEKVEISNEGVADREGV